MFENEETTTPSPITRQPAAKRGSTRPKGTRPMPNRVLCPLAKRRRRKTEKGNRHPGKGVKTMCCGGKTREGDLAKKKKGPKKASPSRGKTWGRYGHSHVQSPRCCMKSKCKKGRGHRGDSLAKRGMGVRGETRVGGKDVPRLAAGTFLRGLK